MINEKGKIDQASLKGKMDQAASKGSMDAMDITEIKAAMEAVLFASGEPVSSYRLSQVFELDESTTIKIAQDLMNEINMRSGGIKMVQLDKEYQLVIKTKYSDCVRAALELRRNAPLSQAAFEVLAIISYNQPVTRAFIEQVRGVECGQVIQGLVLKGLVEEKGRLELPGRPLLYGTTPIFLRTFSLSSLDELPALPDDNMDETTLDDFIEAAEIREKLQEENNEILSREIETPEKELD